MMEGPGAEAPTQGGVPHPAIELSPRARFEVLGAILLALLLGALDQTIVGTALPRIVTDLKGNDLYTWAVTIYLLTSTISVPFYGKLSDLYGRKPLLLFGIVVFLVGSALSGLSQDMQQLILFRGIQGIGAGSLFPISLAVIGDLFTPAERGKYQGLFGASSSLGSSGGPRRFITDNQWLWIFYITCDRAHSRRVVARAAVIRRATAPTTTGWGVVFIAGMIPPWLTNKQSHEWTIESPLVRSGSRSWPSSSYRARVGAIVPLDLGDPTTPARRGTSVRRLFAAIVFCALLHRFPRARAPRRG